MSRPQPRDSARAALTPDEIAAIDALGMGVRGGRSRMRVDFRILGLTIPERRPVGMWSLT